MNGRPAILRVEMPQPVRSRMLDHAAREPGRECCGLLVGHVMKDGTAVLLQCQPARNLSPSAEQFEIDPQAHFSIRRQARDEGWDVIGCYHSHPHGRPEPSARDLAGAGEENFLWLIAAGGELAAFLYRRGAFCPLELLTPR